MDPVSQVLESMLVDILAFLPNLLASLVIFFVSLYLAGYLTKLISRTLERRKTDPEVRILVVKISRWAIVILGLTIALQQVGFDLSAFLAGLGIIGFTIGFALQDVSKNFISGLLLLLQQPFDIGDAIEVAGYSGNVVNVDLRATELYTFDGHYVLIPNGDIFTSPITNYSRADKRRVVINVGVAYESDLNLVRKTALEAISSIDGVLPDPAPSLVFNNFGESSIDCTVYFWTNLKITGYFGAMDAGIVTINAAFKTNGIDIPFPTSTVLMQP
jgi:small conductance mechanosensitive channel